MGDGSRLENGRAMSLEGSTPSPSAGDEADASLAERLGTGLPNRTGGFDSRGMLSGIG